MASQQEAEEDLRCRFCLAMEVDELIPVFCIASTHKMMIAHMALASTGIVISCRDKLPQYTCDGCLGNLDIAYTSWKRCRQSWGNYRRDPTLDIDAEDYRCRICLKDEVEELISLFCICDSQSMKISDIIERFSGLNVAEKDDFPHYICDVCLGELNTGYNFRKLTRISNATLRNYSIETGIEKESRKQTKDDNSLLNEFLRLNDSLEQTSGQTSPKANSPVKSSTENKANEVRTQISTTSGTADHNYNKSNKSQMIIQKPKPLPKVNSPVKSSTELKATKVGTQKSTNTSGIIPAKSTNTNCNTPNKPQMISQKPKTLSKVDNPVNSSTEKKAHEVSTQVATTTSGIKPIKSTGPHCSTQNKPYIFIRKPKIVSSKSPSNERKSAPTFKPIKEIGPTISKSLSQDPLAIDDNQDAPVQHTVSSLHTTTINSEKVTRTDVPSSSSGRTAVQAGSDGHPNVKKASFSNPAEFKMLASRILKKPVDEEEPAASATLTANEYTILDKLAQFSRSRITAFLCSNCDNVCSASAVRKTCIKCKLQFDNCLSSKLERTAAQQGYVEAYCCRNCTYFSLTLQKVLTHLISHNKSFRYQGIVLHASKGTSIEQSAKPAVPPIQSKEPVPSTSKRRAEEPPNKSSKPVAKMQRTEERQQPKSDPKVVGRTPAGKWIRLVPGIRHDVTDNQNASTPRVRVEKQPAVSSNSVPCTTQVMQPVLTVEVVDTDSDQDSTAEAPVAKEPAASSKSIPCTAPVIQAGLTVEVFDTDTDDSDTQPPEVQNEQEVLTESDELRQAQVLDDDMKLKHDPLDIIDTMSVIQADLRPNDEMMEESSNDGFIGFDNETLEVPRPLPLQASSIEEFVGFEEEQLETPILVPLAGRTPDTELFDTLKDTDEYLMVFLKGCLCCGCLKPFKTMEQLKRHRARNHSKAKSNVTDPSCGICRTNCTNAEDHRLLSSKRIFYYCKFCQSLLLSNEDFHSHRESNHVTEHHLLTSIPKPTVYDVILSKLNPKLPLRKLENITHSANPFKSTQNEAIFKTLKETNEFKLLFMKGELCCGCQEWYSCKEALRVHCDKGHTGEIEPGNSAQCELCHVNCRTDSGLVRHRLQRVRRLYYFCKLCCVVLVHHADNYESHLTVAHSQQLEPQTSASSDNVGMLISKAT